MSSLLHEHDPTMDARIVHAVNVSNKKEIAQLKHKEKSLAGSRDVLMHIYRQEEKELVKHLFKLQQEKERRHPEIQYSRQSIDKIQALDFTRDSATHHDRTIAAKDTRTSHPDSGSTSTMSLLQQYMEDAVYQPLGYGHGNNEYMGVQHDTVRRRHNSVPDEKLTSDIQAALSHSVIANAMPSRHQINVSFQPQRQHSQTMAFLEPSTQLKKGSHSSEVQLSKEEQFTDATIPLQDEQKHVSPPLSPGETSGKDEIEENGGLSTKPKSKSKTSQKSREDLTDSRAGQRKSMEDQQKKHRTVMFAVKSSSPHLASDQGSVGSAARIATTGSTSSMECMYDPNESPNSRRESMTRTIIEQEHQKLDSILHSFRETFPVKKELDWQKRHPRPSPSSQRSPFVAHTPVPHRVPSQESSITSTTRRTHTHGAEVDPHHHHNEAGVPVGQGKSHHQYSHHYTSRPSHANIIRHGKGSSHSSTQGSHENASRAKESHFNVARSQRQSHSNIDHHLSSASQFSVERRYDGVRSIYNMPKEAVDDYRNLMEQASYDTHHPSTRHPHTSHHRTTDIPHSHPPRNHLKKSRQKLLALHLLANQQRHENAARAVAEPPKIDPYDTLMCRYLRLSALNVETLVDMCNESGVPIGIHPHMKIEDLAKCVFQTKSSEGESTSGAEKQDKHEQRDHHRNKLVSDQNTT